MAIRVKTGTRPPWVGMAATVAVQMAAGSAYTFPLYSPALKSVLGFSQQQLALLGVANDIGENFGLVPGVISNFLAPWMVLLIGTALCFVGYGVLWLAVSETVTGLPHWLLWIALLVATNSSPYFLTSALVTNMRNFPLRRGTVSGILKGYVGLSTTLFTLIFTGLLDSVPSRLLLFLALGLPLLCLATMYYVRPCTPSEVDDSMEQGNFTFMQIASTISALFLTTTTILEDIYSLQKFVTCLLFGVGVLFLLAPLAIPIKMTLFPKKIKRSVADPVNEAGEESLTGGAHVFGEESATEAGEASTGGAHVLGEESEAEAGEASATVAVVLDEESAEADDKLKPLLPSSSETLLADKTESDDEINNLNRILAEGEGAVVVRKRRRPRRGENFEFAEALVKADFWLLFAASFIGVGSGVTALNNLAQIGIATGVTDSTILLSLFGLGNFFGRLGGGVIPEKSVLPPALLPRTVWMTAALTIMAVLYILLALALNVALYPSVLFLGLCYGVQSSVMVATTSELFGLKNFGIFYNFMLFGNPLGAFLFSGLLAGYLYDQEASKQHQGSKHTCIGQGCFQLTFLILAGLCVLGSALSAILTFRIKPVYQSLYGSGSFQLPRH